MPLTTNIAESSNITQQRNSSSNIFLHSLTVALNLTIQEKIKYKDDLENLLKIQNRLIFEPIPPKI